MIDWSELALGLADVSCATCEGAGMVDAGREGAGPRVDVYYPRYHAAVAVTGELRRRREPCACVLRRVFEICYTRFRRCESGWCEAGGDGSREEYSADFYLICRRSLPVEIWNVLRWRYFLGASSVLIASRLVVPVACVRARLRRARAVCGRAFAETAPYPLFPLDSYLGGAVRVLDRALLPPVVLTVRQQRGLLKDRAVRDAPPLVAA